MIKFLFISCFLLFFSIDCSAQRIDVSLEEVKDKLCKSWKFDHALDDGKISKETYLRDIDLVFYRNYTYGTIILGREKLGSWCYNEVENSIELTTAEFDNTIRIFLLEKAKLIMISAKDLLKDKTILPKSYVQLSPK